MMYSQDHDEKFPPIIFSDKTVGWANSLQPYLETAQIFQCPSEKHERQDSPYLPGFTDYWMNQNVASMKRENLDNVVATILLGDGDGDSPASTASYAINHLPASWLQSSDSPAKRHLDGANYAFVDGHMKWLKPKQITQEMPAKNKDIYTFRLK